MNCIHLGHPAVEIIDDQPKPVYFGSVGCSSCRAYECSKVYPKFALPRKTLDDERVQSCQNCPHREEPPPPPVAPGSGTETIGRHKIPRDDRAKVLGSTVCAVVTWGAPEAKVIRWSAKPQRRT